MPFGHEVECNKILSGSDMSYLYYTPEVIDLARFIFWKKKKNSPWTHRRQDGSKKFEANFYKK